MPVIGVIRANVKYYLTSVLNYGRLELWLLQMCNDKFCALQLIFLMSSQRFEPGVTAVTGEIRIVLDCDIRIRVCGKKVGYVVEYMEGSVFLALVRGSQFTVRRSSSTILGRCSG